jgi:hypothetical protein
MRESKIEQYLVDAVAYLGGEIRKLQWIGRNGAPDRVVMLPDGRLLWIELKATGEKPQPHQLREHARMARVGQRVHVIDSIEGVDQVLGL